jgi:hypothetical protein
MASRRSHFTFVLLELIDLGTAPQDVAVLFSLTIVGSVTMKVAPVWRNYDRPIPRPHRGRPRVVNLLGFLYQSIWRLRTTDPATVLIAHVAETHRPCYTGRHSRLTKFRTATDSRPEGGDGLYRL